MPFLPIVGRELRVAARRSSTYWVRMGAALVGVILATWIAVIPNFATPQSLGITMFAALSVTGYVFCILAGVRTTADCLSEEKREGTLGLLFLTDLKAYDVIFGKFVASSLNVLYGSLAIVPIMAIPLMLGGVTLGEFWRVVLATLNNLFFSLSVGIMVSAMSRDERKAMTVCFLVLAMFVAVLPITLLSLNLSGNQPAQEWFIFTPSYTSFTAFETLYRTAGVGNYYYISLACSHALAWIFIGIACWIVPRTWQDKAVKAGRGPSWWRRLGGQNPAGKLFIRRYFLNINPILWLTARERIKFGAVWISMLCGVLFWLWYTLKYPGDFRDEAGFVFTALCYHTLFKLWIASEAGRRMALDRRSGALELILGTPLSVKSIVAGQMMSLRQQFLIPSLVVLVFDLVFLATTRWDDGELLVWIAGMIVFVADMITLAWVGMWMGLTSRNVGRAAGAAVTRIMVLPWGLYFVTWVGLTVWIMRSTFSSPRWLEEAAIIYWLVISLLFDVAFGLHARRRLLASFRELGAQRFDAKQLRQMQKTN